MGLSTQVKYRLRLMLVGEGLERHVRHRACQSQEQWRQMGLQTQVQHRQQVCCSALVSSRSSFLAPEGCDTLTGITHRRQEGSFKPGLGTSVGGIKPVPIYLVCFVDLVQPNKQDRPDRPNNGLTCVGGDESPRVELRRVPVGRDR